MRSSLFTFCYNLVTKGLFCRLFLEFTLIKGKSHGVTQGYPDYSQLNAMVNSSLSRSHTRIFVKYVMGAKLAIHQLCFCTAIAVVCWTHSQCKSVVYIHILALKGQSQ